MLNLSRRDIRIKIGGEWYSISFRPRLLGRVKDVSVWKSVQYRSNGVFVPYKTEISHSDFSTVEVLKTIWWEIQADFTGFARRLRRKKSTGKLHPKGRKSP